MSSKCHHGNIGMCPSAINAPVTPHNYFTTINFDVLRPVLNVTVLYG